MRKKYEKDCTCDPHPEIEDCRRRLCRYGNCMEFACPKCNLTYCGWGPLMCKCEDHRLPRDFFYKDMQVKIPAPVKENTMRKQKRSRAHKK